MPSPSALRIHCRRELPGDVPGIRQINNAAFRRENEARLVDALRAGDALTLSAVAEIDTQLVGHIAYSPIRIGATEENATALALAPMAVLPDWQRSGVGSALVRWSLDACRRDGHQLIIVLGHPEYYPRFGFVPATPFGLRCPFRVPDAAFLLLELQPGAARARAGVVRYRPEFAAV